MRRDGDERSFGVSSQWRWCVCVSLCSYRIAIIGFWLCAIGKSRCEPMTVACATSVNISLRFELS